MQCVKPCAYVCLMYRYFLRPLLDVEPAYKSNIQALLGEQNALETFKGLRKKDIVFGKIDDASPPTSNENDNRIVFSLGEPPPPKKHRKN